MIFFLGVIRVQDRNSEIRLGSWLEFFYEGFQFFLKIFEYYFEGMGFCRFELQE